jgi:polysaccharide export outer membrane protein
MSHPVKNFLNGFLCCLLVCFASFAQEQAEDKKPAEGEKTAETPKPSTGLDSETKPLEVSAPVDPKSYVIGTEDIIAIRVWREPELSGGHAVRPDGRITLPLIGEVVAAGLTPEKLAERLNQAFSEVLKKPQVMVSLHQVNSKKYFITGEINRSGSFPLITPITVLEALSNAGGFREFANTKKIIIWRGGKRIDFNYKDVIQGKKLEQNIYVEPNDHIIVP